MFEFKLPDLGEGIHEGELLQWYAAQGDRIKEDDPLCEVETDKAAVTIPSPCSGTIVSLKGEPGAILRVGDVFAVIDDGSRKESAAENREEAGEAGKESAPGAPPAEAHAGNRDKKVIAAPATRRLAREMGIDIGSVPGSGPGGRVTNEDLKAFEGDGNAGRTLEREESAPEARPASRQRPDEESSEVLSIPFLEVDREPVAEAGPVEREPLRSLRRKVAVKMTSASILIPHVAHMDEIDVTEIEALRKEYNRENPGQGKLTLLAFVIKAAAAGLRDYPMFNASVDLAAKEIVYKKYTHIGFAADTPRGLMVPVIHDADRQSLAGIGYRIRHLADKARAGEIQVAELAGGTFTVTNVGAIGGTHVFPIINSPESAILGLGRVEKKPVVRDDEIVIRKMLPLTLCFDHRVADGAQAAAFAGELKTMLENPVEFTGRI